MRYKELLSLLESEYDVQVGGASGVVRSAQSDFGTYRVENAAMLTRVNAFINRYLSESCLDPNQTVFGLRQKLNAVGLDFEFTTKDAMSEGLRELKMTRFGGVFGKSDTTPFDEFDNEDGLERTMGHGLTLRLETTIDAMGLYKMEGKIVPTISENDKSATIPVGKNTDASANKKAFDDEADISDSYDPEIKEASIKPIKFISRSERNAMLKKAGSSKSGLKKNVKKGREAAKDYDGDGKVESGTDEWKGSRDKAIKAKQSQEKFYKSD